MEIFPYTGDHIPNILPLDLYISILTRQPTYLQISAKTHCIMTVSYILSDTMTIIHISVSKQILV
jgi:hypothetical protein